MKMWIKKRLTERTTLDGAVLVGVGVVILIAGPFAKLAAYGARRKLIRKAKKNNKERMNIGKSIPSNFYPNHPWWYRLRCVLYLQRYNATHGCIA